MAGKFNICIEQDTTEVTQISWKDGSGNPIDLTNYSIASQIRIVPSSPTASATFTTNIISPSTSGTFTLTLFPSQSLALTGSCYVYDVLATSGTFSQRVVEGKVSISPAVTR